MNIALRLSFQVPEFSKTGKLTGYRLEHLGRANLISAEDFALVCDHSIEKLLDLTQGKEGGATRIAAKFNLTAEQAKLVSYKGVAIMRHEHEEKLTVTDARWT
jgi:GTP:adenosylcobinamide-phosphate guanylyltransferase